MPQKQSEAVLASQPSKVTASPSVSSTAPSVSYAKKSSLSSNPPKSLHKVRPCYKDYCCLYHQHKSHRKAGMGPCKLLMYQLTFKKISGKTARTQGERLVKY